MTMMAHSQNTFTAISSEEDLNETISINSKMLENGPIELNNLTNV